MEHNIPIGPPLDLEQARPARPSAANRIHRALRVLPRRRVRPRRQAVLVAVDSRGTEGVRVARASLNNLAPSHVEAATASLYGACIRLMQQGKALPPIQIVTADYRRALNEETDLAAAGVIQEERSAT